MPVNSYYDDDDKYNHHNYVTSPPPIQLRQSELASLDRNFTELYMTPREGIRNYKSSPPQRRSKGYNNYSENSRNRYNGRESDDDEVDERNYRRRGHGEFEEEEVGEGSFSPILDPSEMAELDPSTILREYPPELSTVFGNERGNGGGMHRSVYGELRRASRDSRDSRRSVKDHVYDSDRRRDKWNEKDPASLVDNLQSSSLIERVRRSQPTYSPTSRRMLVDVDKENVESFQRERSLLHGTSPDLRRESPPRSGNRGNPFKNPITPPKSSPDLIRKAGISANSTS